MAFFKYSSPASFYPVAQKWAPWCYALTAITALAGLYVGLLVAPPDSQQGDSYRIIYLHVPAALMSMLVYLAMAFWSLLALTFNTRLSAMMADALAPTGAWMTAIALWTGSLWGKPAWGTYWAWDARMTSELILLFLFLGYLALKSSIDEPRKADRAASLLCLIGVVNIPVIYFSVRWWNTLHQGATISLREGVKMAPEMMTGLFIMLFAAWLYCLAAALHRVQALILERESHTEWARAIVTARSNP